MDGPRRSEADILAAIRAGDRVAAAEFVRLHQDAVVRVAARFVGRRDVVDDIVQETFVRAFEHIDRLDPDRGAVGWLLHTALNLCRDHARRAGRSESVGDLPDEAEPLLVERGSSAREHAEQNETRARLERAISRLTPAHREVILLHYVEGLPLREISSVVGASVPSLKLRSLRARLRLRSLLEEGGA